MSSKTKDKKAGIFMAALLEMFDDAYDTIAGLEDGVGSKDLLLHAFKRPYKDDLIFTPSVFTFHQENLGALKNKHYALGLAATKFVNMYLEQLPKKLKNKAQYFVDPVSDPEGQSKEFIFVDNWILYANNVTPNDFHYKERVEIGRAISKMVGVAISSLQGTESTQLDVKEKVMPLWEKFSDGYYKKAAKLNKALKKDSKPATSAKAFVSGGISYAFGIAHEESVVSHLVNVNTATAICGFKEAELMKGKWVYDIPDEIINCKSCDERMDALDIKIGEEEEEVDVIALKEQVHYVGMPDVPAIPVHLAREAQFDSLCGLQANKIIGQEEWEYMPYSATICARCKQEADREELGISIHPSLKPLRWAKYPQGHLLHLAGDGGAKAICGTHAPDKGGWTEVLEVTKKHGLCRDCVEGAHDKERDMPKGGEDKVEKILKKYKEMQDAEDETPAATTQP